MEGIDFEGSSNITQLVQPMTDDDVFALMKDMLREDHRTGEVFVRWLLEWHECSVLDCFWFERGEYYIAIAATGDCCREPEALALNEDVRNIVWRTLQQPLQLTLYWKAVSGGPETVKEVRT